MSAQDTLIHHEEEDILVSLEGSVLPPDFEKKNKIGRGVLVFGMVACSIVLAAAVIMFATTGKAATRVGTTGFSASSSLPDCEYYQSFTCPNRETSTMDEKYKDNMWNTPPRGSADWLPGFQDMNKLTGYAQQIYSADRSSCTVNIITRTKETMSLTYHFDGVAQSSSSKTFSRDYSGVLKVVVKAATGESLELEDIDFMWNSPTITERRGDYRNGQKGAIVELFGWPDEDVEKECKFIADAGYLGVKLFPHQEQVMSDQPMENMMNPWYFMYQPVSYKLQGRMGTRDQLRKTIKTCRSHGLRVYADAVINHMSGNGNDRSTHRNSPSYGQCTTWTGKQSSAESPYYTPAWTFQTSSYTGNGTNVLEYPAVPYGPTDFHCDKALDSWADANILSTGWLSGLTDLDTSKEYVQQRIADFLIDLMSIGFSGFRIDAAKHIHPYDLVAIFKKFKDGLGGNLPADWLTWLEVLIGGEAEVLLQRDWEYSFTTGLTRRLSENGFTADEIEKIKIWWSSYPNEVGADRGNLANTRKVIQNDDHDQQNSGSTSRSMYDHGCVLVNGCSADDHRRFEMKLFNDPYEVYDNDNDYPIRLILSSYYKQDGYLHIPDGLSDCSQCKQTCNDCRGRGKVQAFQENAQAYQGSDYTRCHRDSQIIGAMKQWMHI